MHACASGNPRSPQIFLRKPRLSSGLLPFVSLVKIKNVFNMLYSVPRELAEAD